MTILLLKIPHSQLLIFHFVGFFLTSCLVSENIEAKGSVNNQESKLGRFSFQCFQPFWYQWSSGFSVALATGFTHPLGYVDVLKVRLQMQLVCPKDPLTGMVPMQMNSHWRKGGPILEMRRTISEEGINVLWKGMGPAMSRAAALTPSQWDKYDEFKWVKF